MAKHAKEGLSGEEGEASAEAATRGHPQGDDLQTEAEAASASEEIADG